MDGNGRAARERKAIFKTIFKTNDHGVEKRGEMSAQEPKNPRDWTEVKDERRSWEMLKIEQKKGSVMSLEAESESKSRGCRGILKIGQRGSREEVLRNKNRGHRQGDENGGLFELSSLDKS